MPLRYSMANNYIRVQLSLHFLSVLITCLFFIGDSTFNKLTLLNRFLNTSWESCQQKCTWECKNQVILQKKKEKILHAISSALLWSPINSINPLSANLRKRSNTLEQFFSCCWRIFWVYLTILWGWWLKG